MRIVVVMGRALDPAGIVVNRRRGRIFVNREEYVMQPADACALRLRCKSRMAVMRKWLRSLAICYRMTMCCVRRSLWEPTGRFTL